MKLFEIFATLGMDTSEFTKGIEDAARKASEFVSGIQAKTIAAGALLEGFAEAVRTWFDAHVIKPLETGFASLWGNIRQGAMDTWNSIVSAVAHAISRIREFLRLQSQAAAVRADGGGGASRRDFATGLDYVPYNEFPARLHVGEAVLTAAEAESWRRGESRASSGGGTGADLAAAVKSALSGMAVMLDNNEVGRIQERTISGLQTDAILAGRFG